MVIERGPESLGPPLRGNIPIGRPIEALDVHKDSAWLVGAVHSLTQGQRLVSLGSLDIDEFPSWVSAPGSLSDGVGGISEGELLYKEKILAARNMFFDDFLGWGDPKNPMYSLFAKVKEGAGGLQIGNLSEFVGAVRILEKSRVQLDFQLSEDILRELVYFPGNITESIALLRNFGLHSERVLPGIVGVVLLDPQELSRRIEHIFDEVNEVPVHKKGNAIIGGVDIIHNFPALVTWDTEGLDRRIAEWDNVLDGVSGAQVMVRGPRALAVDPSELPEFKKRFEPVVEMLNNDSWNEATRLTTDKILADYPDLVCLSSGELEFFDFALLAFREVGKLQPKTHYAHSLLTSPPEHVLISGLRGDFSLKNLQKMKIDKPRESLLELVDRIVQVRGTVSERSLEAIKAYFRMKPLDGLEFKKYPSAAILYDECWTSSRRVRLTFPGSHEI